VHYRLLIDTLWAPDQCLWAPDHIMDSWARNQHHGLGISSMGSESAPWARNQHHGLGISAMSLESAPWAPDYMHTQLLDYD